MKFICQIFFFLISLSAFAQQNQLWKGYYSYLETKAVTTDLQNVFFATDNAVFSYNDQTKETEIFNTINGLKIDGINAIAYAADYKKVVVGSKNGKVAILDMAADKVYHLYDIFNKANIPDNQKNIKRIVIDKGFAYLATGYGITSVRLNDNHFGDTYYIGVDGEMTGVNSITIAHNHLYAATEFGMKKASLNSNLIDFNNWQTIDFSNWIDVVTYNTNVIGVKDDLSLNTVAADNLITSVDNVWGGFLRLNVSQDALLEVTHEAVRLRNSNFGVYKELVYSIAENGGLNDAWLFNNHFYLATRKNGGLKTENGTALNSTTISPVGPISNNVFSLSLNKKDLTFVFGGYDSELNPYGIDNLSKYGLSTMKNLQTWNNLSFEDLNSFKATTNYAVSRREPTKAYLSSFHDGLLKMDLSNGALTHFNGENSSLSSVRSFGSNDSIIYDFSDVRVNGLAFDTNGKGWFTSALAMPFLGTIDANDQIQYYNVGVFSSLTSSGSDSYLVPVIDKNGTKWIGSRLNGLLAFNETRNNKSMQINTNHNLADKTVKAVAVDYNNQLWIGTSKGLRIIPNVDQFLTTSQIQARNIVIMYEGKAQELFFEQDILGITVDGSNNKWISIADAGVFLISPNGNETIYNFTKENSPLPSNDVLDIEIDGTTGEVFFATRLGVVSFKNYATTPSGNLDDIKVYPNPVKPNFTGDVKVSGLTSGATVKITDIAGNLVFETKSLGGTVTWNTYNFGGTKVASGVYMVFITSEDGTIDAVKKIMIIR